MIRDKILKLYIIILVIGSIRLGIYHVNPIRNTVLTYAIFFSCSTIMPFLLNKFFHTKLSNLLIFIYVTFSLSATFLGAGFELYHIIFWWDIYVHLLSGVLLFLIGLKITKNLKISTIKKLFFILMISMSGALLWEIYEFTIDSIFKSELQEWQSLRYEPFIPLAIERGHGLVDSMMDMIYGIIGNLLSSIFYFCKSSIQKTTKYAKIKLTIK